MALAIRCTDLVKTYPGRPPVEAVRGLDLEVESGECFGVLGPNGAGKTTTIEILEGILEATSGLVEVLGRQWSQEADAIRRRIGISLQETRLAERLTVLETLTLFRSFYPRGLDPDAVMRRVSLEEKADVWIKNLSGGQRQRLAVATALVGDPQLLFLDEPTTGLDPQSRRQLWEIIREIREQGRTILLTTHYMEEAEQLCDRVAIVDRGQIIAIGSPRELIAGLGSEHIVEFSLDPLHGTIRADRLRQLPGVIDCIDDEDRHQLSVGEPHVTIPALVDQLEQDSARLLSLSTRNASLEDVFMKITGRTLEQSDEG